MWKHNSRRRARRQVVPSSDLESTEIMDPKLDVYIRGKPFVVDSKLQNEQHIKTLTIKYVPKVWKKTTDDHTRSDPKNYTLKIAKEQEKAKSCPLYKKRGVKNFLLLDFEKSVHKKILKNVLSKGLLLQVDDECDRYLFFGHTATQLRQKTCVLYNESALKVHFDKIISEFGMFDMNNVSKRAARIGLLLSSSKVVAHLEENQIKLIDDIEHNGFNFTDGCGFISEEIAKEVVDKLQIGDHFKHQVPPYPSVYQVRIQGCKGVLMLSKETNLKGCIAIRKSMVKFKWNPQWKPRSFDLGIVNDGKGTSFPNRFGFLNRQYIRLLSGLGVKDEVFLNKQNNYFKDLSEIETNQEVQLRLLCAYEKYDLVDNLLQTSVGKTDDAIMKELCRLQQKYCSPFKGKTLSEGLRIPLEKSRSVYGVADPSEMLKEGQCFFQPTIRGKPTVLDTNVVVGRSPTYHPGDIRVLKCVQDEPCVRQLLHLVDCIVFPVQGRRPHANEMSGGDLDGDKFFVCWDEELIPPRTVEPTSYQGSEGLSRARIEHEDLKKHFIEYNPHILSKLDQLHWMWADAKGVACAECDTIAKLFNEAVDCAKTGAADGITKDDKQGGSEPDITLNTRRQILEGKDILIPGYLEEKPDQADPPFVWYTMHERAVQWNLEHLEKKGKTDKTETTELQYLQLADMIAVVSDTDCRMSEFKLFKIAFSWAACRSQVLLKQLLPFIDLQLMDAHDRDSVLSDFTTLGLTDIQICIGIRLASQDPDEKVKLEVEEFMITYFSTNVPRSAPLSENSVDGLSKLSLEGMCFLLTSKKQELSQFQLYQLCTAWCKQQKEVCLLELMRRIDFPRMTFSERKLALKELTSINEIYVSMVTNALFQSIILNSKDIKKLKGFERQQERWVLYHRCEERKEISWPLLNGILEMDIDKLLVFKFLIGGEIWVIAMTIQQLSVQHCVKINRKGDISCAVVISIHNHTNEYRVLKLPDNYYVALDRERLQIFSDNDRTKTFVCLWNIVDGEMGMSVALDKFDSSFLKSLGGDRKLTQEYVDCIEVFLNTPSPMTAPAVYGSHRHSPTDVDEETAQHEPSLSSASPYFFHMSDFPLLGELPEPEVTEIEKQWNDIELKYYSLKQKLEMGLSIGKELKEWLDSPRTFLESQEALRLEELLHHCSDLDSFDANDYVTLLTILIQNLAPKLNIQRLTDTMKRNNKCLTWKHFCRLIDHITFACANRDFGILLLKYFRTQGKLQQNFLNVADFYSSSSCQYMIHWLPTITIEFLHKARDCETIHSRKAKSVIGKISVDTTQTNRQIQRTVYVTIEGSHQPFKQEDGLVLSWSKSKMIFYARIQDLTGMVWSVHIVWPRSGAELLEEQLKLDKDAGWQIEAFPNLVTHYRQIDALRTLCIRNINEPEPSEVIQKITQLQYSTTEAEPGQNPRRPSRGDGSLNESQLAAVEDAMTKKLTLIQGPPGTGKTRVAAAIVKEWLKKLDNSCKILVTAQSNEAVNILYKKMMEVGIKRDQVMRVGRKPAKIPREDRTYCFEEIYQKKASANHKGFDYKLAEKLLQSPKVICCTCVGAGSTILKSYRFPYVLIDEAPQAVEPVSLIPMALGAETICLIGDDKQLRPFVKSTHATELKQSLFDRLKKCQKLPFHMLNIQYRMHPKLSDFPLRMFYEGKLQSGVQVEESPLLQGISWMNPTMPVIFYNITSAKEDYQSEPGSVFNEQEAKQVLQVVKQLQMSHVSLKDIGIISPYKAQVEHIRKLLKNASCDCDVRTVDGFQGQERDIIIVSTVRVNSETYRQLGFLDDQNRMNVLLTRAKQALIVVGNRNTLQSNALWKNWIELMEEHKLILDK